MNWKLIILAILATPVGMALVIGSMWLSVHWGWAQPGHPTQAWLGAWAILGTAYLLAYITWDTYRTFRI